MELFDSDSNDEDVSFKINRGYAKSYEKWRKKEEKQKLIDKYGEQDATDSSSEEEEIRSTPQMDKDWLRAYAVVRFKQPRLYKEGEKFFKDTAKPVSKKKEKAVTLKDHERKFILEKGGIASDEESKKQEKPVGMSYFEEQEEIKKNLKDAIGESSEDEPDEDKNLLYKAHKTEEQKQREDNEYLEWLKGERESLGDPDAEAELAPLKKYWNDPNISEKERVLRDYVLNNGYMDQEESDSESDEDADNFKEGPDPEEEEKFLEEAEKYEHKYNFRHEEPGGDEIKSYPRVIETSVRTKDTRRAEKRKEKMEKKRKEKDKMKDEIRLLQKLQMEEKMEKLEKLRQIANRPDLDYDLDADFDPDKHSEIMKKYFDDDYYDENDADQKPTFDYDPTIDEEEDEWWKERLQEEKEEDDDEENDKNGHRAAETSQDLEEEEDPDVDDPNFIMDADYDPSRDYKAEKKRAKKYGKAFAEKLPVFDPTTKTFDEYIDEYLKDKINDLPFTYRKVAPNDYGLTTEEILSLPDRELNAWVSVKKMSQFRTQREEAEEQRRYQVRAKDLEKKKKILPSLFAKQEENPESKSKKKKKKRKRKKEEMDTETDQQEAEAEQEDVDSPPAKKLKTLSFSKNTDDLLKSVDAAKKSIICDSLSEDKKKKKKLKKEKNSTLIDNIKLELSEKKQNPQNKIREVKTSKLSNKKNKKLFKPDASLAKVKKEENIKNEPSEENHSAQYQILEISKKLSKKKNKSQSKLDASLEKVTKEENVKHVQSDENHNAQNEIPEVSGKNLSKKKNQSQTMPDTTLVKIQKDANKKQNNDAKKTKKKTKNADDQMKKKKKLSINMKKKLQGDEAQKGTDNRELERQLSKIMSASRLSKYGLGPNVAKETKKKKKRKKLS